MPITFKNDGDHSYDVEDLLQIKTRCSELKKEKDMLRESQSQSFELIRRLELHVKTLSEACSNDKTRIQELERELRNCSQEIDYLQDQLNARDTEVIYLGEQVHNFELKLENMENYGDENDRLREELVRSHSERLVLLQKLESKDLELKESTLLIEKLEWLISTVGLESQCEIESMKLDLMTLEQSCFEAKKLREDSAQEKDRTNKLIQDLELKCQDAQKTIDCLSKDNKEMRKRLEIYEINARELCKEMKELFEERLEDKDRSQLKLQSFFDEVGSKEMSLVGAFLGPFIPKLSLVALPDAHLKAKTEKMSHEIHKYKVLVEKLKEELKEEKLKAKEEAEDLAQEMAELRYQITGMLEEECKRRACIEQAALQRIAELEAQIQKEQRESLITVRHLGEA